MQTISIEISNSRDLEHLLWLIQRLGLKLVNPPAVAEKPKKDLAYHLKIIEAGVNMPEERLQEFLKWHEEDRQDRPLPFRDYETD